MMLSKIEIINFVSKFYSYLSENEIAVFLSISEYGKAKNKEIIFKSGRTDKNVILILKGVARSYSINDKGEELNDYIRAEGNITGDGKVFGNIPQILTIEAIGEIHFLKFDINKLEALGFENPKIMTFYLNILKEIIVTLTHRVNTFVSMTSKERYLDLIKWNPIYLKSTYDKHLASFLGITPLTLHRIKKATHIK